MPLYRKPLKLTVPRTLPKMPLVVPGVTTESNDKTQEWSNKLVGKKITDDETSNEVVSHSSSHAAVFHPRASTNRML